MKNELDATFGSIERTLVRIKRGAKVFRSGWNNPTIRVFAQFLDEYTASTEVDLVMEKGEEDLYKRFPLDLSAESIVAKDWEECAE